MNEPKRCRYHGEAFSERCILCYIDRGLERPEWFRKGGGSVRPPRRVPLARVERCENLLQRIEHKIGCGGMTARHACKLELPAVPAHYCQTCDRYEAEPGVGWLT